MGIFAFIVNLVASAIGAAWLPALLGLGGLGGIGGILALFLGAKTVLAWAFGFFQFAVGIWTALPKSVRWILILIVTAAAIYLVGDSHGRSVVQDQWDFEKQHAVEQAKAIGSKANADAEKSVPALSPADRASDAAVAPRGKPCVVRDRFDRDCAGR